MCTPIRFRPNNVLEKIKPYHSIQLRFLTIKWWHYVLYWTVLYTPPVDMNPFLYYSWPIVLWCISDCISESVLYLFDNFRYHFMVTQNSFKRCTSSLFSWHASTQVTFERWVTSLRLPRRSKCARYEIVSEPRKTKDGYLNVVFWTRIGTVCRLFKDNVRITAF